MALNKEKTEWLYEGIELDGRHVENMQEQGREEINIGEGSSRQTTSTEGNT